MSWDREKEIELKLRTLGVDPTVDAVEVLPVEEPENEALAKRSPMAQKFLRRMAETTELTEAQVKQSDAYKNYCKQLFGC